MAVWKSAKSTLLSYEQIRFLDEEKDLDLTLGFVCEQFEERGVLDTLLAVDVDDIVLGVLETGR